MAAPKFHRRLICPDYIQQAEIDVAKARAYARLIANGAAFPLPIVARYGEKVLPIDGHHRLEAHRMLGLQCDVLECGGRAYDNFSASVGSFEADRIILEEIAQ